MRITIGIFTASLAILSFSAYAEVPKLLGLPINKVILAEKKFDALCRGDNDQTACEYRDAVGKKLNQAGYCYGKKGQYGYEMRWHKCTSNSIYNYARE